MYRAVVHVVSVYEVGNDVGIDNLKVTGNGNNYFEDFEDRNARTTCFELCTVESA